LAPLREAQLPLEVPSGSESVADAMNSSYFATVGAEQPIERAAASELELETELEIVRVTGAEAAALSEELGVLHEKAREARSMAAPRAGNVVVDRFISFSFISSLRSGRCRSLSGPP
jgi:hypothetical protein